ncbi:MAG: D-aminoacyl-tRNA deacylase [Dehalococcoidia bacterium]|nr:D-aminoacyl-tRNA deacylase [Dehalococcoidia bacterium]
MRAVVQRVSRARVTVEGDLTGEIGPGLLVYLGIGPEDGPREVEWAARKVAEMRIFPDEAGRFDRSVEETGGAVLVVSQFTLYADTRKGRRPAFTDAAPPEVAAPLVEAVMATLRARGLRVEGGRFGAHMLVEAVNDGPVTIVLDSTDLDRPRG